MMTVREAYAIFFLETCKRAEEMDILKLNLIEQYKRTDSLVLLLRSSYTEPL